MIDQALIDEAHVLALTIAPELSRQPLYILERPDCIAKPVAVTAWAARFGLTLPLKKYLQSIGRYRGDGPVIVLNEPFDSMSDLAPIVIHENAHIVPSIPCAGFHCESLALENWQHAIATKWAADPLHVETLTGRPWRNDHGAKYIRRVLHLHARAQRAGHHMGVEEVFDARNYGLSYTKKYMEFLGDEPERFMSASFAEIEAAPMPSRFRQLFISDCRTYTG